MVTIGSLRAPEALRESWRSIAPHRWRKRLIPYRGWLLGGLDLTAWVIGFVATGRVSFAPLDGSTALWNLLAFIVVISITQLTVGHSLGLYGGKFRVGGYDEAFALARAWGAALVASSLLELAFAGDGWLPEIPVLFRSSVALTIMMSVRLAWRTSHERALRPKVEGRNRVVIFGAGEGGYLLVRAMMTDPRSPSIPVALLDDDPTKAKRSFMGVTVDGALEDLPDVVRRHDADLVVIAIPSATSPLIRKVIAQARKADVEVRTLPATSELVAGTVSPADVRPINENDLLGRAEVHVDIDKISKYVTGKRVLVTGAGGSIGSELCRQLSELNPADLIMLDRDESGLHSTQLAIEGRALLDTPSLVVADIRDRARLSDVFARCRPEVVFHAAALKHLTLLEHNPVEGLLTNVFGTQNVIEMALEFGAECVVNVSTDKAADPTSVLGATKLLAEQVAVNAAHDSDRRVVSVRFGNVLGSRGSVLPTFLSQIERGGPVTVTHPQVTRYFMTIPEAVRLVLEAGAIGSSGEIMILDMGEPVPIVDLAQRLIDHHRPGVEIEFTGLRPGEKLHEILVADHERGEIREHPRIFHTITGRCLELDGILADLQQRQLTVTPQELVMIAVAALNVSSDQELLT